MLSVLFCHAITLLKTVNLGYPLKTVWQGEGPSDYPDKLGTSALTPRNTKKSVLTKGAL